ncbi:MAG: hypothetical protein PWQ81_626 [Bacteroidota bacterium]|jgi:hypothetical protein|nr:hypothetical protein [Bacteroidota bacterium]MDK2837006.1 hypothetical protein [Bacteroidota bacterium]MDN5296608.1 hypothetical protein [Bacteroidota bacterium]MDN5306398.1 hypothetical protein [Bacteroidota bacterium]OPZ15519.1 MAG: hypothetical protein BWZ06_00137 [Bacteroidetes bacterium ADurb.BinA261]
MVVFCYLAQNVDIDHKLLKVWQQKYKKMITFARQ